MTPFTKPEVHNINIQAIASSSAHLAANFRRLSSSFKSSVGNFGVEIMHINRGISYKTKLLQLLQPTV